MFVFIVDLGISVEEDNVVVFFYEIMEISIVADVNGKNFGKEVRFEVLVVKFRFFLIFFRFVLGRIGD